jgi:hypothetical protein
LNAKFLDQGGKVGHERVELINRQIAPQKVEILSEDAVDLVKDIAEKFKLRRGLVENTSHSFLSNRNQQLTREASMRQ